MPPCKVRGCRQDGGTGKECQPCGNRGESNDSEFLISFIILFFPTTLIGFWSALVPSNSLQGHHSGAEDNVSIYSSILSSGYCLFRVWVTCSSCFCVCVWASLDSSWLPETFQYMIMNILMIFDGLTSHLHISHLGFPGWTIYKWSNHCDLTLNRLKRIIRPY